jgi:hypothetical protein
MRFDVGRSNSIAKDSVRAAEADLVKSGGLHAIRGVNPT